jgi:5-methylcytosine-specific restriction endonuclease McrA
VASSRDLRLTCPLSAWTGRDHACHWCDRDITGARRSSWCSDKCRNAWERNHVWRRARAYAKKRAKYLCTSCGADRSAGLEVNHITPVAGAGYGESCAAHQENLETLCHGCHVKVTATQRAAGLLTRPRQDR